MWEQYIVITIVYWSVTFFFGYHYDMDNDHDTEAD